MSRLFYLRAIAVINLHTSQATGMLVLVRGVQGRKGFKSKFNSVNSSRNLLLCIAGPSVVNVYINYEKKFAFVEFRTGEHP